MKRYRSAITGRFIRAAQAFRNEDTTEQVHFLTDSEYAVLRAARTVRETGGSVEIWGLHITRTGS